MGKRLSNIYHIILLPRASRLPADEYIAFVQRAYKQAVVIKYTYTQASYTTSMKNAPSPYIGHSDALLR
jgi:hypothetical protein